MLRFLTRLDYLLRETLLGLRRGGWMNWAAISTVTVLLFLFGISLQTSWQVEGLLNQFGSQLEVSVYLETGVQADSLEAIVRNLPQVAEVQTVSKEEAWTTLVSELGLSDITSATQQLNGNPLVDELKVKAREPEQVPILAQQLKQLQGVDEVQYVSEAVQQIAQLNQGLAWVSGTITTLLTLTALAVITTTIRLIVIARRREVEIMQLVGATTAWIYLPFILQGVTFGVVGGALAWGLIQGVQRLMGSLVSRQPEFIQFLVNGLQLPPAKVLALPLILLWFGAIVGVVGSLLAVRRVAVR
ncbi:MAG: ABC transporter permease [Leptolyngbyaceae cyanobacterium bins.59]|nr:ABC transporter permease [Leptolyngbyaceae cyanobacterium bins.59]